MIRFLCLCGCFLCGVLLFGVASLHGDEEVVALNDLELAAEEAAEELVEAQESGSEHQAEPGEAEYWEALIAFLASSESSEKTGREMLRLAADLEFTPAQNFLGCAS